MKKLAELFSDVGFKNVSFKSYSGGAAAGHVGFK
jgi:demethylmenaquinone methyltransferase / 2-methoxy-6-polyprenyl-1,4-benzoquinol methylase